MKFGTSGLRGLASDLAGSVSSLYAEAFVLHLRNLGLADPGTPIFLGRDFRASSPKIRDYCAAGLVRQCMNVVDCGALPTPALAAYAMSQRAPSLMVTGSHIPGDRNGIKFYRSDGEIGKADEIAIEKTSEELRPGYIMPEPTQSLDSDGERAASAFLDRCRSILPVGALSGLRVGIYEHSSVARDMLEDVLGYFGSETVALGRAEGFVAVDTEAVSAQTRQQLTIWAAKHGLHAIVSTDGDADRPLVADENGSPLRGDLLGLVTANFLGADIVATPVTTNSGIRSSCSMEVMRTKVGSPYVIEAMNKAVGKLVVGFEANGGFLLQNDAKTPGDTLPALPTRDCFLPIVATLYRLKEKEQALSRLVDELDFPVAVADRLKDFPTEQGTSLVRDLIGNEALANAFFSPVGETVGLDITDGARFTLNGGEIIHYRPSGNAPELRCYCEAATHERAMDLLEFGLKQASERLT